MKRWLVPITITAGLAAGAGPAVAAAPVPVDTTPFPIACPTFDLTAQLSGKSGTIALPGGRLMFNSPDLRIALTGPTGKTASYVITGGTWLGPRWQSSVYAIAS